MCVEPDEEDEDDSDGGEDIADDDASETSSLVGNNRSLSISSSLPSSRKPSPLRYRVDEQKTGLLGRVTDTVNGVLGRRRQSRKSMRGEYDSLGGVHEQ